MNKQDLYKYQKKNCRIIMEKRHKHQNMFKCVYGTVETVNDSCLYMVDIKGFWLKIPAESIRGIQTNRE